MDRKTYESVQAAAMALAALPQDPEKELTEEEQKEASARIAKALDTVAAMNEMLMKDEPLKLFLWRLNLAVLRTGVPVPRSHCLRYGIDKRTLNSLVNRGFLKEYTLRHSKTRQIMVGYTLADDVTFDEQQVVKLVQNQVQEVSLDGQRGTETDDQGEH